MPETARPATNLNLISISFLQAIPDTRRRREIRIPAWYLLLVAVLGILSRCQSLRDLERFAIRHHSVLTEALGIELRRPPSDSAFRYFFRQHEDAHRYRGNGAGVMAPLRTAALKLLRLSGFQSVRAGLQVGVDWFSTPLAAGEHWRGRNHHGRRGGEGKPRCPGRLAPDLIDLLQPEGKGRVCQVLPGRYSRGVTPVSLASS